MARRQFRSQPTLQRSGGRTPVALVSLCLIAGAGLGLGAVVGTISTTPSAGRADHLAVAALDSPATAAAARPRAPPPAASAAPTPGVATLQRVAAVAAAHAPARKARPVAARPAHKDEAAGEDKPLSPQEQWARQRHDYDIARAAYDASERNEGFRWAQQNRIRSPRYCRVAERRDLAFV